MSTIRRCVCPGSYDPITLGHVDVITRATRLYDEVVVAVLDNPAKQGLFDVPERLDLITGEVGDLPGVVVMTFRSRLIVDVCREIGAEAIVKGLRGETDYAYEVPMAVMNRHLSGVETVFLPGEPNLSQVSSSLIKEVARFGGDVSAFVGPRVEEALRRKVAA